MRPLLRLVVVLLAGVAVAAQDGSLPVPANVKAEGLPPISASVVEKLKPYASFGTTRLLAWHPTRNEILVSNTSGPTPQLHVVTGPGVPSKAVADGVSGGAASFGPLGADHFVYHRDAAGAERFQLFRFDVASAKPVLLTDGKSRYNVASWASKTSRIAFTSTKRNGKDFDLYVMDPMDPSSVRVLAELSGAWSVADWSPDDSELLLIETPPGSESAFWTYNLETGARTAITADGPAALWRFGQYSPDGKSVYAISNRESDVARVWRREAGTWKALTKAGDAVESVAVSPDGATMAVVFDRDAASRLELIDTGTLKTRLSPDLPAGTITDVRWNPAGAEVGLTLNTLRTNGDVFSVHARTGKVTRWTTSNVGGLDPAAMPDPKIIQWKSFDGRTIAGVLYRAPSRFTGPRPVMINIHGGPAAYERPRFQGRSGYFLNELGVAIIYPNVRGSLGFGRAFERLDDEKKREDSVKDIGALLDWIATQKEFDARRVMVTGASYGGYMTYAVAAKYPERIRCAFAGSAIADYITFLQYLDKAEPQRVDDRRREYGDERDPAMRDFLVGISPLQHVSKIKVPLAIAHGKVDPRVPVAQAEAMFQAAKANNVPVWLTVYEDEGHAIGQVARANGDFNFYVWITFVEKYLVN